MQAEAIPILGSHMAAGGSAAVAPAWLNHLVHDLRGPLSPLANALALLRSGRLDAQQQLDTCSLAQQQIDALSQLLDDTAALLGSSPRSAFPVELGNLLDMLKVRISRRLYAAGTLLHITPPPQPVEVIGDMCGLVRLLAGLLLRSSAMAGAGCQLRVQVALPSRPHAIAPAGPGIVIGVQGDEPSLAAQLATLAGTLAASSQIHIADAALARIITAHGLLLRAMPAERGGSLLLEWPRG